MKVELQTRPAPANATEYGLKFVADILIRVGDKAPVLSVCLWLDKENNLIVTGEGIDFETWAGAGGEEHAVYRPAQTWKSRLFESTQ